MNRPASQSTGAAAPLLLAAGIGVLCAAAYAWLSVRHEFIGNISDAAIYLILADFFSPFRATSHGLGMDMLRDYAFPPAYPLVLALFGGGSEHAQASYMITAATMGAAVAAVFWWLHVQRLNTTAALAITIVFALLPSTLLTALGIQSEPLYVALIFTGFALLDSSGPGARRLGALTVGVSVLARTVGIAAVAAVGLRWLRDSGGRSQWQIPVLAVAPLLCWFIFKQVAGVEASYLQSIPAGSMGEVIQFLVAQLGINVRAAWVGFYFGFDLAGAGHARFIVAAVVILAVIGWVPRVIRFERDALYVLFYLLIIAVWPYPNHMRRFLQVLLPLILFYGYIAVGSMLLARASQVLKQAGAYGFLIAVILAAAPTSAIMLNQLVVTRGSEMGEFTRSPQWYLYGDPMRAMTAMDRTRQLLDAMRGIEHHVPRGSCVSSPIAPFVPLYGHRRAQPVPGPGSAIEELAETLSRCPYVFMASTGSWPPSRMPPLYPYERLEAQLEVIEVTLWDRSKTEGKAMTILAKYRAAE